MLQVERLAIEGVLAITPQRFGDERGFFSETYNRRAFAAATGLDPDFVQDNHTLTREVGTVRGLHFQRPPHAQGKLVRVSRGRIFDVVVDVRRASPTYGRHVAIELSAASWSQLWVPVGLAHGFMTLEPDVEVLYKMTAFYDQDSDGGIQWRDAALGIVWPNLPGERTQSTKDAALPRLADITSPF